MKIDKDIFTELVLFEISGRIRESEKAELHQIIAEDQEAYDLYRELYLQYAADVQEKINEKLPAAGLWKTIHDRRTKRQLKRVLAGTFVCSIIALIFLVSTSHHKAVLIGDPHGDNYVQLKTASGKVVNLNTSQGQLKVDNFVFKNINNTFSYSGNNTKVQFISISTPAGQNFSLLLQDGTSIQLNSLTTIQFPSGFTGTGREVFIQGEAYFKVAKNEQQPFQVHLPTSTIQVLGTEFNVNTYEEENSSVSLVAGVVKVAVNEQSTVLQPGFQTRFNQVKIIATAPFVGDDVLSWRQGTYLFNAATLQEIATLIHRVYGITVKVEYGTQRPKVFTGSMDRSKPVENFLAGLKFSKYIDYSFDKDSILTITQYK